MSNINKRIPEIPTDGNKRQAAVIMAPILSGGTIIDYLPIKAVSNGDGTATLSVGDVTLTGDVTVTNVKVGSEDGQVSGNRYLKVLTDGTVITRITDTTGAQVDPATAANQTTANGYLLNIQTDIGTVTLNTTSIKNALDVNLSTRASEATLLLVKTNTDGIVSALATLNATDFATEATLALVLAQLDVDLSTRASEATLALIKAKTDNLDVALSTRASETTLGTRLSETDFDIKTGALTETAPISDTASSGLNGRLQRIAQNITSLISTITARINTLGQKLMSQSTPVVLASDHSNILVQQAPGTNTIVRIESGDGLGYQVKVSSDGRLLVSQEVQAPIGTTPVSIVAQSVTASAVDTAYTITNGETLIVQKLQGGGDAASSSACKISLFEDPNGTLTPLNLIGAIYVNGSTAQLDFNKSYVGNGIRRIILRREVMSGAAREILGRWEGYEQ